MSEAVAATGIDAAAVDAAIARVLQAERDARESVLRCAQEAESIVERANERARQIARSAAQRSVRVQRWSAATLQRELERIAAQQAQIEHAGPPVAAEALRLAVDRLAARLTGGAP